jgi:hypothetical protein
MSLLWVILLADTMTMVITIAAAIKRPILSYRVIGVVAICAFIAALHQVVTAQFTPLSSLVTALLVLLIIIRAILNKMAVQKNGKG